MTDGQLVDRIYPNLMGSTPTAAARADALAAIDDDGRGAWFARALGVGAGWSPGCGGRCRSR